MIFKYNEVIDILARPPSDFCAMKRYRIKKPLLCLRH